MARSALTMVNRVLTRMREPRITAFSTAANALDVGILDAVNTSARTILYEREWEFMKRWGELVTRAPLTGSTGTVTQSSTSITLPGISAVSSITGDVVARLNVTDDATYDNTSFRIVGGISAGGSFAGSIATSYPGASQVAAATWQVFFAEYLLGPEAAGVYQVEYEQRPITLIHSDEITLHKAYPRVWETMGDPETVAIGGTQVGTYDAAGSVPDAKTRVLIYPVPDAAYVLRYQYLLRFTELSASTDTIPGLPDEVADMIEDRAYARIMESTIGNDMTAAALVHSRTDTSVARLHARSKQDKGRRYVLRSLDSMGRTATDFGRMPDDTFEEV